jgi:hypothetical protein
MLFFLNSFPKAMITKEHNNRARTRICNNIVNQVQYPGIALLQVFNIIFLIRFLAGQKFLKG